MESHHSADEAISKEIIIHPELPVVFNAVKGAMLVWAQQHLPQRDNRDIATAELFPTRSGMHERRLLPARFNYDEFARKFDMDYDSSAHQRLIAQLHLEYPEEELQVASIFIGMELGRQVINRRRTQSKTQWQKMQASLEALNNDDFQIFADIKENVASLEEGNDSIIDAVWHDIQGSPPERIQQVNTMRFLMGIVYQAFGSLPNITYWNYPLQSVENSSKIFWRALGAEFWERDLMRGQESESEKPLADYLIAGCSPMSTAHINKLVNTLR